MPKSSSLFKALLLLSCGLPFGGCGDDPAGGAPPPVVGQEAGVQVMADAAPAPVAPPVSTPVATPSGVQDAAAPPATSTPVDSGASAPADAGARDAGPIVLTIPTRSVACGGSECTTTNNKTCCQAWSKGSGFMGTPMCTTNAACTSDHIMFGDSNRAVVNDCDEPSDCSAGQICCFVRYGAPVTADLLSPDIVGPGASRLCMELSNCNAGTMTITGVAGIPVGVQACKTAADCKDATQCVPESNDSATTGKGGMARPGVMVCK